MNIIETHKYILASEKSILEFQVHGHSKSKWHHPAVCSLDCNCTEWWYPPAVWDLTVSVQSAQHDLGLYST